MFGGSPEDDLLEVEDETQEADELFDEESIPEEDMELEYVEELDQLKEIEEEMGFTEEDEDDKDETPTVTPDSVPEIKETASGKQRCPFCHKEYKSVLRHVGYCKKAPPGGAEALKKKYK